MARLTNRIRYKPYAVTIGGETKYFCGCGLSGTQTLCDRTHAVTSTESSGGLYWYDKNLKRNDVVESYTCIRDDSKTKDA